MTNTSRQPTLDGLYKMVAYIYSDKIASRAREATFNHLVEVCGMLTIHDRRKKREAFGVTDALCKALGWYFPLLAKLQIASVEDVVFRKFPKVCPYCRHSPHKDAICKQVKGTEGTVNHDELKRFYSANWNTRPTSLNGWQQMFQDIYPREADDRGRSTIGLLEEIGEMAEAVRVFDRYPKYFLGEAADLFSYLMGIANEHAIRLQQETETVFSFEDEFIRRYPGLCPQCGSTVCVCPAIPAATVGRMAKELDLEVGRQLKIDDAQRFSDEGAKIAIAVLEEAGGYAGIANQFPFDRGDANHALIKLCLGVADAIQQAHPEISAQLRAGALQISNIAQQPGSPKGSADLTTLLDKLGAIWRTLDNASQSKITGKDSLTEEIGEMLGAVRVLLVLCSPKDAVSLRLMTELRTITESVRAMSNGRKIFIEALPSATIDDLRRALLTKSCDVLHFSGHSDSTTLVFEDAAGASQDVSLQAIRDLISKYPKTKCVVLNGCESGKTLTVPIGGFTVAMQDSISDDAAIEFSKGFYDALAAGKDLEFAFQEGVHNVSLRGLDSAPITVLK